MYKLLSYCFLWSVFFTANLSSEGGVPSREDKIVERGDSVLQKKFELEFLQIFPNFDFNQMDLYLIIAYFYINKPSFSAADKALSLLQDKFSNEIEIVRQIYFFKLVLCYVKFDIGLANRYYAEYRRIFSSNFLYRAQLDKLLFLIQNQSLSNSSDYSILSKNGYYQGLYKSGNTDAYIDALYELMCLSKELIYLRSLVDMVESPYGASWVESLWYCLNIIEEGGSEHLDIYYCYIIEFLCSQGLEDEAWEVFQKFRLACPNSTLIAGCKGFFDTVQTFS